MCEIVLFGGVAPGKVLDLLVVQVGAENRVFDAGLGEDPEQAEHNMGPGPVRHILLVPAVHKTPSSTQETLRAQLKTTTK